MFAYVGSFTTVERKARGDGIHVYRADPASGAWTHVQHVGDLVNPSYLAVSRDECFLYCVHGDGDYASAFSLDRETGRASPARTRPSNRARIPTMSCSILPAVSCSSPTRGSIACSCSASTPRAAGFPR